MGGTGTGRFLKAMTGYNKRIYKEGWKWLVAFDWTNVSIVQKLWFANQIDRFIRRFKLGEEDRKRLKYEISVDRLRNDRPRAGR